MSIITILLLIFIVGFICIVFNKSNAGDVGEKVVARRLKKLPDEYYYFNGMYLQSGNYSTQIDHVVVSIYGIFVIETKNYKGNIYGDEKAEEWTQIIMHNRYPFQNPIKQNRGHVYCLMRLLNLPKEYFIPIVVFTPRCNLYVNTNSVVIYTSQIIDVIMSYKTPLLSEAKVKELATKLNYSSFETRDTVKTHVAYARYRKQEYHGKIDNRICPRCGGHLVERVGRYGNFMGCSNYPECTYTHKL